MGQRVTFARSHAEIYAFQYDSSDENCSSMLSTEHKVLSYSQHRYSLETKGVIRAGTNLEVLKMRAVQTVEIENTERMRTISQRVHNFQTDQHHLTAD
jgi:hypothetical protein